MEDKMISVKAAVAGMTLSFLLRLDNGMMSMIEGDIDKGFYVNVP